MEDIERRRSLECLLLFLTERSLSSRSRIQSKAPIGSVGRIRSSRPSRSRAQGCGRRPAEVITPLGGFAKGLNARAVRKMNRNVERTCRRSPFEINLNKTSEARTFRCSKYFRLY